MDDVFDRMIVKAMGGDQAVQPEALDRSEALDRALALLGEPCAGVRVSESSLVFGVVECNSAERRRRPLLRRRFVISHEPLTIPCTWA